jgi:hypothetical protein
MHFKLQYVLAREVAEVSDYDSPEEAPASVPSSVTSTNAFCII